MVSLVLAFSIGQALVKDVHIAGTTLDKAIEQLSQIYKSPMDVSTLLKGKVILIEANQVSEEEARNQVAKTLNATWEKRKEVWHLTKTAKQTREDEARAVGMRLRFLKKTFELREKALKEKPAITKEIATQVFNQLIRDVENSNNRQMRPPGPTPTGHALPYNRLFSRFLLKFGYDRIAAIPNGQRVVFALHPNAMQQKMDIDLNSEIAAYRTEQETWLRTAEPLFKSYYEGKSPVTERHIAYSGMTTPEDELGSSMGSLPEAFSDLLFTVYCSSDGSYKMQLTAVPRQNDAQPFQMDASSYEGAFAGMEGQDFEIKEDPNFKLSQEASDFEKFFMNQTKDIPQDRLPAMLAKFSDPVVKDPLAYGLTEAIVYDIRRTKRNIVALLGDGQLNIFVPMFADVYFDPKYKNVTQDFIELDGKWVRMFDFPFMEPNFPRQELKNLIVRVKSNKRVNLDDRARIASLRPRGGAVSYIERLLERFVDSAREEYGEDDALKIIGMLNESEREIAFGPNGLPYSQMSPKLKDHLYSCAYNNERCRIGLIDPSKTTSIPLMQREPTYIAPKGIIAGATLRIERKIEDQVKSPDTRGYGGLLTDAKGWGSTKYQLDHPEDYPGNNFTFDRKSAIHRVRCTVYTLKFLLTPDCQWTSTLQNVDRVPGPTFTIDTFPDDLKADFDEGYKNSAEWAKKNRERLKKKDGGGGTASQ